MSATVAKNMRRQRRKRGIRKRVIGTPDRPRLSVTRSHKNISAQIIDDLKGVTLCQASSRNKDLTGQLKGGGNVEAAKAVGVALAERAKSAGVSAIVFDRNGYKYHGRIKALAEAMREAGLKF